MENKNFFFERNQRNFFNSILYKKLSKYYKHFFLYFLDDTLRIEYYDDSRRAIEDNAVLYYSSYIYLLELVNNDNKKIADVGCGDNFIKKYIDNVVGYDKSPQADFKEYFDEKFIVNHYEEFDCAFAINSLHFISINDFVGRINDFAKIIKPGGKGFLTFNLQRLIDYSDSSTLEKFKNKEDYIEYFNNEIKKVNHKILVFDNLIDFHYKKVQERKEVDYNALKGSDWPSWENFVNNNYKDVSETILNELLDFKNNYINMHNEMLYSNPSDGNIRLIFQKEST